MKGRGLALLGRLGVIVAAITYAVLAHESNLRPNGSPLGVGLALGPFLLLFIVLAWRTRYRVPCLLLCLIVCFVVGRYWFMLTQYSVWLYLIQQASSYVFLGIMFGRSLIGGRVPLCTLWATLVHGPLTPAVTRYTRSVTAAWTVFFALLTILLVVLFAFAPLPAWSFFANFCTFPLIVALFVAEYIVRGRVLPNMRHAGILEGARAFFKSPQGTAATRRR